MSKYMFERLTALDNSFLVAEQASQPMHVAAVNIFEAGDLARPAGGIDVNKIRQATLAEIHRIPRYRQKLKWVPLENRPVWVDDPHFNIDYHIRHAALPYPGGVEELKKLTGRITSRVLDRARPLWEIWVIEGLSDNRFAIISKIHHCMIDGVSGADLAQILYSITPDREVGEPRMFMPRSAPTSGELLLDAVSRYAQLPGEIGRAIAPALREPGRTFAHLAQFARSALSLASFAAPSSDTPLNGTVSPHRRVDWLTLSLDDVKAVKNEIGCSVNDVVLGAVTGTIRQYLIRRSVDPRGIDFRISAPVSTRRPEESGQLGNRVSAWIVRLPVEKDNPLDWVEDVRQATSELKRSNQAMVLDFLMKAAEYVPSSLVGAGLGIASEPMNMIVTNIPGPPIPLYLLGAKLLELQPLVPLLEGTGLGVALFSYDGKLHVGFNADYERVPDLPTVTSLFAEAFLTIMDKVGVRPGGIEAAIETGAADAPEPARPSGTASSDAGFVAPPLAASPPRS